MEHAEDMELAERICTAWAGGRFNLLTKVEQLLNKNEVQNLA